MDGIPERGILPIPETGVSSLEPDPGPVLQSRRRVEEGRLEAPLLDQVLQRSDAERLRRIVTREEDVDSRLLRFVVGLSFPLAGHQRVRAHVDGLVEPVDPAAGNDRDVFDLVRPEREVLDGLAAGIQIRLEALAEFIGV